MLFYCKVMKLADMPSGLGGGDKEYNAVSDPAAEGYQDQIHQLTAS